MNEEIMAIAEAIAGAIKQQKEIMTIDEVSEYTGIPKATIYKYTANRVIPYYKPTGRACFFKRSEVNEWLTSNRISTQTEINERAAAYCMRNPQKA